MRKLAILLALSAPAGSVALAADTPAQSKIEAVTVFPSGAEVTRTLKVKLGAGEQTLLVDGITGEAILSSVRIEVPARQARNWLGRCAPHQPVQHRSCRGANCPQARRRPDAGLAGRPRGAGRGNQGRRGPGGFPGQPRQAAPGAEHRQRRRAAQPMARVVRRHRFKPCRGAEGHPGSQAQAARHRPASRRPAERAGRRGQQQREAHANPHLRQRGGASRNHPRPALRC